VSFCAPTGSDTISRFSFDYGIPPGFGVRWQSEAPTPLWPANDMAELPSQQRANKRAVACTIRANFKLSKAAPPSVNLAGELLFEVGPWNDDVMRFNVNDFEGPVGSHLDIRQLTCACEFC
jgi:hypothetical protein